MYSNFTAYIIQLVIELYHSLLMLYLLYNTLFSFFSRYAHSYVSNKVEIFHGVTAVHACERAVMFLVSCHMYMIFLDNGQDFLFLSSKLLLWS